MRAEPSDPGATTPPRRTPRATDPHPPRQGCASGSRGGTGGGGCVGSGGSDEVIGSSGPRAVRANRRPPREHLEDAALRRAIDLARADTLPAGLGARVGCVLLGPDGGVVGEGRSDRAARVHAVVAAIADAGPDARGATAVVSLEPCGDVLGRPSANPSGGAPVPCARALVDAGVRRVVVAQPHPGPTSGDGTGVLRAAGVEVVEACGEVADDALALNRPWSFGEHARRPLVTWVVDHGTRGPDPDLDMLRSAADTLVVSTWTVLAHDVSLAVLDPDGTPAARQPLRVVLGTRELDPDLPVLAGPGRTLHFATRDPHLALEAIYDLGGRHVLLAGGPALATEFLRAGVVDEVVSHVEPELSLDGVVGATDLGVGHLPHGSHLHDVRIVEGAAGRTRVRVTLVPGSSPLCDGHRGPQTPHGPHGPHGLH